MTYLGASQQALGNLPAAMEIFAQARAQGGGSFPAALANYPLTLYLRRHFQAAESVRALGPLCVTADCAT